MSHEHKSHKSIVTSDALMLKLPMKRAVSVTKCPTGLSLDKKKKKILFLLLKVRQSCPVIIFFLSLVNSKILHLWQLSTIERSSNKQSEDPPFGLPSKPMVWKKKSVCVGGGGMLL